MKTFNWIYCLVLCFSSQPAVAIPSLDDHSPGNQIQLSDDSWCDGYDLPPFGAGINGTVHAITVFKPTTGAGRVVIGGSFFEAGDAVAFNVAQWNGELWEPIGLGLNGPVFALQQWGDYLVAGGQFTASGAQPLSNIAFWNGYNWNSNFTGFDAPVRAMDLDPSSGELVVGGDFLFSENTLVNHIAISTDEGDVGGTSFDDMNLGLNGPVHTITQHYGFLYVGGAFTDDISLDTENERYVAVWDGAWLPLVNGLNGPVNDLVSTGSDLIAGGEFTSQYLGADVFQYIAKWTGGWAAMDAGFDAPVNAVAYWNGQVYAAGSFTNNSALSQPLNHIAYFDAGTWQPLASGIGPVLSSVETLHAEGNALLHVGGTFTAAGAKPSVNYAIWARPIISGFVTDSHNGHPVFNATVTATANSTFMTTTDADGFYLMDVDAASNYSVSATHMGYFPETIQTTKNLSGCDSLKIDLIVDSKTVVLLHGALSSSQTWHSENGDYDFAAGLVADGFHVVSDIDLVRSFWDWLKPRGSAVAQARVLSTEASELGAQGIMSFDIVAHSMGGLVSRYYLQNHDDTRVRNLVMLGTPNHGMELMNGAEDIWIAAFTGICAAVPASWTTAGIVCLVAAYVSAKATFPQAFRELQTSSDFLDDLNYNGNNSDSNRFCDGYAAETTPKPPNVNYFTYRGTVFPYGCGFFAPRTLVGAWVWKETFCDNDEIVEDASVPLADASNFTDSGCGLDSNHKSSANCVMMTESSGVKNAVSLALMGQPMCGSLTQVVDLGFAGNAAGPAPTYTNADTDHFVLIQADSSEDFFSVSTADTLRVSMAWEAKPEHMDGTDMDLYLYDPVNTRYDATTPGISYSESSGEAEFRIPQPMPGTWKGTVFAVTSPDTVTGWVAVSEHNQVQVFSNTLHSEVEPGEVQIFTTRATWNQATLTSNLSISATLTQPDDSMMPLVLLNDLGAGADTTAGDGVWTAEIALHDATGPYVIDVEVNGIYDGSKVLNRDDRIAYYVERRPDLHISASTAWTSPPFLNLTGEVTISASFTNLGIAAAESVVAYFFEEETRRIFSEQVFTYVEPSQIIPINAKWKARLLKDSYTLGIRVDVLSGFNDIKQQDNEITLSISRSSIPTNINDTDDTAQAPRKTRLLSARPNPFNPQTKIVFDLRHTGYVTLEIYDVSGRRVRTLLAEQRNVGRHEIVWDGRDTAGRRTATGIYLARMQAPDYTGTLKIVLVR